MSIRDIMDIMVIPVLHQLVSTIISCIIDPNIFGHYKVPKIFLTGNFIRIRNYNESYYRIVHSEIKKKFHQGLRSDVKNWLEFSLITSWNERLPSPIRIKHFAYDLLKLGEPLIAMNSSYLMTVSIRDPHASVNVRQPSGSTITHIHDKNKGESIFKLVSKGMHIDQEGVVGTFYSTPKYTISNFEISKDTNNNN
jgi:hypothetical protein